MHKHIDIMGICTFLQIEFAGIKYDYTGNFDSKLKLTGAILLLLLKENRKLFCHGCPTKLILMNWIWIAVIAYFVILILICLRIIFETHSSTKSLAYLLFCIFIPVIGMFFYIGFGINYWKSKMYSGKLAEDEKLLKQIRKNIPYFPASAIAGEASIMDNKELVSMLIKDIKSPLTRHNKIKLLVNGEEKFPELLKCLENAKHHIHMEYYIYEQDEIGNAIIELLIKKAKEGVEVRFIYDDFGSPAIKKKIENRIKEAGIEIYPFSKVYFFLLANRINYRNHRKIVVIDGQTGFVGGINVSDKYINNKKGELFWVIRIFELMGRVYITCSTCFFLIGIFAAPEN